MPILWSNSVAFDLVILSPARAEEVRTFRPCESQPLSTSTLSMLRCVFGGGGRTNFTHCELANEANTEPVQQKSAMRGCQRWLIAEHARSSVGAPTSDSSKPLGETCCVALSHGMKLHADMPRIRRVRAAQVANVGGNFFANATELPATTHMVAVPQALSFENAT